MKLNYLDEDNCPVVITVTMRQLNQLIEATADIDAGPAHRIHRQLIEVRREAVKQGELTFKLSAADLQDKA